MIFWGCSTRTSPASPNTPSTETGIRVFIGDWPGGPLDHGDVTVEDAEKGHCFDEMWGIK